MTKSDVGEMMARLFEDLAAEWKKATAQRSTGTDERTTEELRLPASESRMVFFAVPHERISLYRDELFQTTTAVGLAPVTAADVVTPGESALAKLSALVDRADVLVADLTQGAAFAAEELGWAMRRPRPLRGIAVVVNEGQPFEFGHDRIQLFVDRPSGAEMAVGWALGDDLRAWITRVAQSGTVRRTEARQLLVLGQPTAAVIFAFRNLEQALRTALRRPEPSPSARLATLGQLVNEAAAKDLLTSSDLALTKELMSFRNRAVHGAADVSMEMATHIVDEVDQIVRRLVLLGNSAR